MLHLSFGKRLIMLFLDFTDPQESSWGLLDQIRRLYEFTFTLWNEVTILSDLGGRFLDRLLLLNV